MPKCEKRRFSDLRVGIGFDIHRFSKSRGRKLVLGQVEIDYRGLEGASDADVVLHSICDAILGAAGEADIGTLFPPESSKGITSKKIAEKVIEIVSRKYKIVNIDCVIVAQKPKLGVFIPEMKKKLSELFSCDVNIRVKSPEHIGDIGKGKGISAISVALLKPKTKL
ncbi:2-C-methyl-D-erythritol 2,4-cyclodiphosphate synthase [bacterium HR19]|nr:2-C-methyl-D-erythritol 2,4-cyclodiphosphate synthase [bacterium HR19]